MKTDFHPSHRLINLGRPVEARAWIRHFGVTIEALAAAIEKVGPSANAVRKELANQALRDNLNQSNEAKPQ